MLTVDQYHAFTGQQHRRVGAIALDFVEIVVQLIDFQFGRRGLTLRVCHTRDEKKQTGTGTYVANAGNEVPSIPVKREYSRHVDAPRFSVGPTGDLWTARTFRGPQP